MKKPILISALTVIPLILMCICEDTANTNDIIQDTNMETIVTNNAQTITISNTSMATISVKLEEFKILKIW